MKRNDILLDDVYVHKIKTLMVITAIKLDQTIFLSLCQVKRYQFDSTLMHEYLYVIQQMDVIHSVAVKRFVTDTTC